MLFGLYCPSGYACNPFKYRDQQDFQSLFNFEGDSKKLEYQLQQVHPDRSSSSSSPSSPPSPPHTSFSFLLFGIASVATAAHILRTRKKMKRLVSIKTSIQSDARSWRKVALTLARISASDVKPTKLNTKLVESLSTVHNPEQLATRIKPYLEQTTTPTSPEKSQPQPKPNSASDSFNPIRSSFRFGSNDNATCFSPARMPSFPHIQHRTPVSDWLNFESRPVQEIPETHSESFRVSARERRDSRQNAHASSGSDLNVAMRKQQVAKPSQDKGKLPTSQNDSTEIPIEWMDSSKSKKKKGKPLWEIKQQQQHEGKANKKAENNLPKQSTATLQALTKWVKQLEQDKVTILKRLDKMEKAWQHAMSNEQREQLKQHLENRIGLLNVYTEQLHRLSGFEAPYPLSEDRVIGST